MRGWAASCTASSAAAGLADVAVTGEPHLSSPIITPPISLSHSARASITAQDAGDHRRHEAALRWLDALAEETDVGRFFAAMTCFTVWGAEITMGVDRWSCHQINVRRSVSGALQVSGQD